VVAAIGKIPNFRSLLVNDANGLGSVAIKDLFPNPFVGRRQID